ncbi:UDP-N-acetylglucosamine 1-carboxyvinyltransferase [Oscillibacter sp. MSJ-2]|uniref:UDP-N-acetylglucosamine 1-carboxyvinyltransferase n=1 Tax=Dysosmobacter acutus TaxID=2841504 RepID=A0ABS6FAH5_9FIRM|nr:UDP-N-acetylglucosamine 1-carboxyvinyltransferase [Dysosmobacter acutus]MBU5626335.1 UDP-N-acetylglucosamine 1-carboxyvinyltransferase [Dysosmobacter acutus]
MGILLVDGGRTLQGQVEVQGAKNSVLPILAATILACGQCVIKHCPRLRDVDASIQILRHLGCSAQWESGALVVDTAQMNCCSIPDELMREMRSSVIFLGAVLARCGQAELSYPGGCELGPRPIDLHLTALRALGADIEDRGGTLRCQAEKLCGTEIVLSLPSVGATENAILAACGAEGTTVICNAAREPEIMDLQEFLVKCGARIHGAGSSTVTVEGGRPLHGCVHRCIADRIAAATLLSAVAAAGGEAVLTGVDYRQLSTVTAALSEAGCRIRSQNSTISIARRDRLHCIRPVRTAPYPGFPTDAQAVLMAALLRSAGATVFVENIFENRYRHVDELARMGADIRVEGRVAVVCGVESLHGATLRSTDLRGGAALCVAALAAQGQSEIGELHHIDRGYEDIARDLRALGASVRRVESEEPHGEENKPEAQAKRKIRLSV